MSKYCHWMMKKVAQELAGEWYETQARDNEIFKICPDQKLFIHKCWGHFLPLARVCLVKSLNSMTLPESAKEDIMEALILDKSLPEDTAVHRGVITEETGRRVIH